MLAPVIKEMQVEITTRYHHTPMRLSKVFLKIMTSPNANEGHWYVAGGNGKWYSHSRSVL